MFRCKGATFQGRQSSRFGFTLVELVVLIATLTVAVIVLPSLLRPKRSARIGCTAYLKQVALAFRMWSNDHGEEFPMELTITEGGTRESALRGLPLPSFITVSNELNSPKVLVCPQDSGRTRVTAFAQLAVTNVSYFLGVDASEINPYSVLTGDRNLLIAGKATGGLSQISKPQSVTWSSQMHVNQGNLALADGSAFQTSNEMLQKALGKTGLTTNRFAIP